MLPLLLRPDRGEFAGGAAEAELRDEAALAEGEEDGDAKGLEEEFRGEGGGAEELAAQGDPAVAAG